MPRLPAAYAAWNSERYCQRQHAGREVVSTRGEAMDDEIVAAMGWRAYRNTRYRNGG